MKEPPRFQNDAERECAKVLDFYGVPWEYEPHTFVLEEVDAGRSLGHGAKVARASDDTARAFEAAVSFVTKVQQPRSTRDSPWR